MSDLPKRAWRWNIFPGLAAAAFAEKPNEPLPVWASKNVFLDRRMTTRPGFYDPEEYPWTWEFQEIMRTRFAYEKKFADGAVVLVDGPGEGVMAARIHQMDVMKSTQSGFTEAALNGIRYCVKHDPQNVIFAIDSRVQAGEVNEIRLQPTLRKLGEKIFTSDDDDAGKFILKLRRMLIYFLGSYSAGAFSQKMCELGIGDELEEHGSPSSAADLRSRMKSAPRRLLVLMSKPQMIGGPIDKEHAKGSCHVPEVPCPHCTEANGDAPAGFQQLEQDNMKFGHCKTVAGEWDFARVLSETYFECVHCKKPIEERWKRWMNDRSRRRWRRTNFEDAEPDHISFQVSDFYSYDDSVTWGRLAMNYIKTKGDPVGRQGYRNHNEGKPYEVRETKTEIGDILILRGDYMRGVMPWLPRAIVLGSDVGLTYVKWVVLAIRATAEYPGEAAVIDYGKELHPDDIVTLLQTKTYLCAEDGKSYPITIGGMDEKYRKLDVQRACLRSRRRLIPTAGISADLSLRSLNFTQIPQAPRGFGIISYVDRDAKHDLYTDGIAAWAQWHKLGCPADQKPIGSPIHFFKELNDAPHSPHAEFINEWTKEHLIEIPGAHSAKQFVWKRSGPNHWADAAKVAKVIWRFHSPNL